MAEWYYQGYFDMTLMLKAGEGGEFVTLGKCKTFLLIIIIIIIIIIIVNL